MHPTKSFATWFLRMNSKPVHQAQAESHVGNVRMPTMAHAWTKTAVAARGRLERLQGIHNLNRLSLVARRPTTNKSRHVRAVVIPFHPQECHLLKTSAWTMLRRLGTLVVRPASRKILFKLLTPLCLPHRGE